MVSDEGYILSNKFRRAVFDSLISGESRPDRIAKKHRLIKRVVEKVIDDFKANDLIREVNGRIEFTEKGEKIATELKD